MIFLTLMAMPMQLVHLCKDTFLAGYNISTKLNLDFVFMAASYEELPDNYRNCRIVAFKERGRLRRIFRFLSYIWKNAKDIKILNLYHSNFINFIIAFLFKLKNKKGIIFDKLDFNPYGEYQNKHYPSTNKLKFWIKKRSYDSFIKRVDIFSAETEDAFNRIISEGYFGNDIGEKLILMPNGFDEEILTQEKRKVEYSDKENLIITVGRIGSEEKRNDMLLKALEAIDMRDWKAAFIGPVTEDFYQIISASPYAVGDEIIITGEIDNRNGDLFDWYKRAKVFCLTSEYESFALVLAEALACGDYIISTKVGAAPMLISDQNIGKIIENEIDLARELSLIINDENKALIRGFEQRFQEGTKYEWSQTVNSFIEVYNEKYCN